MATIAAGQLAGMSRAAALEFSFFLSMPTMAVATLYDLYRSLRGSEENPLGVSAIDAHGWIVLAIGFVVSFAVAYGAVAWFMAWVRRRGFVPFAIYRIALGILVLALAGVWMRTQ
jgi:undecaprenyl-diphosphatase